MRLNPDGSFLFFPTDLVNFLGCCHFTFFDLHPPSARPPHMHAAQQTELMLQERGFKHEHQYLRRLKAAGRQVIEITTEGPLEDRVVATNAAITSGAEVIYQAALQHDGWAGYADFLVKTGTPSELGDFSYEVIDTKLSWHVEAKHLIQLGVYAVLLSAKQGIPPAQIHLVLGNGCMKAFPAGEAMSLASDAMHRFAAFVAAPPAESKPIPCEHCPQCPRKSICSEHWSPTVQRRVWRQADKREKFMKRFAARQDKAAAKRRGRSHSRKKTAFRTPRNPGSR